MSVSDTILRLILLQICGCHRSWRNRVSRGEDAPTPQSNASYPAGGRGPATGKPATAPTERNLFNSDCHELEKKVLERDPSFGAAHATLGRAYLGKKMYADAIAEFQRARLLIDSSGMSRSFAMEAYAYAQSGRKDEAQKMLDELKEKAKQSYVSPDFFALIYTGLGDNDHAFEWLQKCYEERRDPGYIKVNPIYDNLRSDPRFTELLRRMNLAP